MRQGYTRVAAVVQHDINPLTIPFTAKALYVGGAAPGDVKVLTVGGSTAAFQDVQPGTVLPIVPRQVFDTGTTVADADMFVLGD
jgi:hypothetical protein